MNVFNTYLRLLRAADGKVVYDGPIQFRSGTAPFHSWTVDCGTPLRRVAETGYRMIAGEILEQLPVAPSS